jgi:hypothetical protein
MTIKDRFIKHYREIEMPHYLFSVKSGKEMPADNERFGAMAALPRRQFSGNLHVTTPQQVQWKPPLRQAAGTLAAMRGR